MLSLGLQIIDWIETYLVHGPGDIAGEPIIIDDEFGDFIHNAYELGSDGKRQIRRAILSRPKGRAKSELAGMLVCVEAVGPCRFSHFATEGEVSDWGYPYEKGEPVGKPLKDPFIRCLATEETQADNTYGNVHYMMTHLVNEHGFTGLDIGTTRIKLPGNGQIVPSTASSSSKDGGKETFCVMDESHRYDKPELKAMFKMVSRNLAKRKIAQPWMLETTTAFIPGAGSIAEASHELARKISTGEITDTGFLFDHRQGPLDADFNDDDSLRSALTDAYGAAAEWMDLDRIIAEIRDPITTENEARRYFLNQAVGVETLLVDPLRWDVLADPSRTPSAGDKPIVLCFDGSKNRDATALLGWTIEDRPHLFVFKIWARPENADADWEVPRRDVRQLVADIFEDWDVRGFFCDPFEWRTAIEEWEDEYGEDLVKVFDTTKNKQMGEAIDLFLEDMHYQHFTHDGDPLLRSHVLAGQRATRHGYTAVEKETASRKIDALVAAIIGNYGLRNVTAEDEPLEFYVGFAN